MLSEKQETWYKLAVFVPENDAEKLRNALGAAGAGKLGNYSHCSYSLKGTGRFLPEDAANPYIGTPGKAEEVAEQKLKSFSGSSERKSLGCDAKKSSV